MAQPLPYERDYDFQSFQAGHPTTPLPGDKVNLELDQVAETFNQVLDRIKRLQRDDLALANKSVGYDQLMDEVSLGFNPPTAWVTAKAYVRSDSVFVNNGFYRCIVTHTSGVFATDLAAGNWQLVADFTSATSAAQAAQVAAEAARDLASGYATTAAGARDTAVGASAAAGTSAGNAAISETSASASAATALTSVTSANAAQLAAESARDGAVTAQNAAAVSANDAAASATAAATSADEAAASAQAAYDFATPTFATKAAAEAYAPAVAPDFIRTAGYSAAGDGGGALYKKVAVEPTHAGKFSITLADAVTVMWYEIAETVIDLRMFGVVPGAVGDQAALVQAAFSVPAREIYIPINPILADGGKIRCDSTITRNTHVKITGPGTIDFSQGASGQLLIEGSVTPLSAMSATMTKHSKTIQFASDQGLAPGDVIILYNPTDFSFGGRRDVYRDGGMFKVHSLSGFNALTYEMATDAYTAASMQVGKLNSVRVEIDGITVIPCSTTEAAPICVRFGADVKIGNAKCLAGGTYGGIQVDRCYNVVFDFTIPENNSAHVNNEYGIIISSCQHVSVRGAGAFATRHAVTLGTNGQQWSVPCRHVNVAGMSLWNHPASATAAADCHGCSDFVTYTNCIMAGGPGGGRNIRLDGCTIFGMSDAVSGLCITAPELNGGYFDILNCELISEGDGADSTHGYILIQPTGPGGFGYPAETWTREDLTVRIKNVRLKTPNAGTLAKAVFVNAGNADKKTNVVIDGLEWEAPQGLSFLSARDVVAASLPSDYLIVDNVYGPSGAYLIGIDADIASVPTREMRQTGFENVAISTSVASAIGTGNALRYRYSRTPNVSVGHSSIDATAKQLWGGKAISAFVYQANTTTVRLGCRTTDGANFASADNVRLQWTAGVSDV